MGYPARKASGYVIPCYVNDMLSDPDISATAVECRRDMIKNLEAILGIGGTQEILTKIW